jgi:hypothetical protein
LLAERDSRIEAVSFRGRVKVAFLPEITEEVFAVAVRAVGLGLAFAEGMLKEYFAFLAWKRGAIEGPETKQ